MVDGDHWVDEGWSAFSTPSLELTSNTTVECVLIYEDLL